MYGETNFLNKVIILLLKQQEDWNGLLFPSPGDLPETGIEPMSPALAGRFFATEPPKKPASEQKGCLKTLSAYSHL